MWNWKIGEWVSFWAGCAIAWFTVILAMDVLDGVVLLPRYHSLFFFCSVSCLMIGNLRRPDVSLPAFVGAVAWAIMWSAGT